MKLRNIILAALLAPSLLPAYAQEGKELKAKMPELESAIQTLFTESGVPGASVAIVWNDEVIYMKGFGVRQVGHPEKVDVDTIFQLASCSKPVTSTAVAALVSKHKLSYEDPVIRYLPDYKLHDGWVSQHASLADMLSHRSGLPGFAGDLLESLGLDRTTILQRLRYLEEAYGFRAGYAYTNFGFTTGGEAAARACGLSFEDMLQQELFRPLEMSSSSGRYSDFAKAPNHAHTHILKDGKLRATERNPDPESPAGGVSSSLRDMIRFAQFHLDQGKYKGVQMIAPEVLEATHTMHAVTRNNPGDFSKKGYYGMGWALSYDEQGRYRINHAGAFSIGARTSVTLLPQQHLGIVVLANAFPSGLPEGISAGVIHLYDTGKVDLDQMRKVNTAVGNGMAQMLATSVEIPKVPFKQAAPLKSYVGTFQNDYLGPIQILERDGHLVMLVGKQDYLLTPETKDAFVASPIHASDDLDPFRITFKGAKQFHIEGLEPIGSHEALAR